MSSRFKVGDIVHYLPDRTYLDDNNQWVKIAGEPIIGVVTGFNENEKAIVQWQNPQLIGRTETYYDENDQFSIWNGSCEEKLLRKKTLMTRKKKPKKKKFDIGTLVSIPVLQTEYYDRFHPHKKLPTKNETGIIIGKDGMEIYFQIYLQESMKTVWREYDEITKV